MFSIRAYIAPSGMRSEVLTERWSEYKVLTLKCPTITSFGGVK